MAGGLVLIGNWEPSTPRIRFAWSPVDSGRFVVRAGYGVFYSRSAFFDVAWDFLAQPFYEFFQSFGQTFSNPFPNVPPVSQFPTLQPGTALSGSVMDRNNRTPYFQHFNTSLEYQLGRDTAIQVAYVGSRGIRLFRQVNVNQSQIASTKVLSPMLSLPKS